MRLTRRSLVLLAFAVVLAVLNLVPSAAPVAADALPSLPAVQADAVVRVQISTPIEKLRIERASTDKASPAFEKWNIVAPLEFPADAAQIRTLLHTFSPGLPMEAYVDSGNHEDYGVDDQHGYLVELFTAGEDVPAVAVMVGKTAAGPSTFVRIPGAQLVYRADVGGQARYARPAADWRDKMAVDLDQDAVSALTLARGKEVLQFTRGASVQTDDKGKPVPAPWVLAGAPFPIDDTTVDAVVHALARIRAGDIHNPDYVAGLETPTAVATLVAKDGTRQTITLGSRQDDGVSFIRVGGRDEVFRVSGTIGRVMTQPVDAFRDRSLLAFARQDVASVAYVDRGLTVVLSQADDGATWSITQPPNMDVDQKQALFTVNTLAALHAAGIPADTRFDATGARIEVRFRDGHTQALELGQVEHDADGRALVRVRVAGKPGVYQLRDSTHA